MSGNPDPAKIPAGPYCYGSLSPMDERGIMQVNGPCPYRERRAEGVYCAYLQTGDDEFGLLADQVKICDVNNPDDFDFDYVGKNAASGTPAQRAETTGSVAEGDGGPTAESGDAQ